jgi:cytochrome c oxidase assembly protein subunit 15
MQSFKTFGTLTIIAIYLLILVGGVVRSTGSGMGCPDWPKCFGQWIPPTQEAELPANYKDIYKEKRIAKNERFAKLLNSLGFDEIAYQITKDPSVLKEEPFNAIKTWIEYLNRVLGVLIGFFIFLTFLFSIPYRHTDRQVVAYSFAAFVMVGIEGFLGSLVVSTNLLPILITVHMLLALAIVLVLIYALARTFYSSQQTKIKPNEQPLLSKLNVLLWAGLLTSVIQITLGTQIREAIDHIAAQIADRSLWIDQLGLSFYIHRSFSLLILSLHLYLAYTLFTNRNGLKNWAYLLATLVFAEVLSGVGMAYLAFPAFLQPLHLTLAAVIVGVQFWVWLLVNPKKLVR